MTKKKSFRNLCQKCVPAGDWFQVSVPWLKKRLGSTDTNTYLTINHCIH